MNLFVIMMLLNLALVWLMMCFSICLRIIISICLMIIILGWYFEITFIPLKKDCADHPFESTFISSLGQHNLWKQFFMPFVLKWYMTFISKWAKRSYLHFEMLYDFHFEMRGRKFRTQNYFSQQMIRHFIDENTSIITIFVHSFLRSVHVPTLALK